MSALIRYSLFLIPELFVAAALLWLGVLLGWMQPLTAMSIFGLLLLTAALLFPAIRKFLQPGPPIGARALVGREGALVRAAAPVGRLQLDGESWLARSKHDDPLPAGTQVRVVDAKGLELMVELIPREAADYTNGTRG